MKKTIILLWGFVLLYSCASINNYRKEYKAELKNPSKSSSTAPKWNHQIIQSQTIRSQNFIIHLHDGTILRGYILNENTQNLTVETAFGRIVVNRESILKIEQSEKNISSSHLNEKGKENSQQIQTQTQNMITFADYDHSSKTDIELSINYGKSFAHIDVPTGYSSSQNNIFLLTETHEKNTVNTISQGGMFFNGILTYFIDDNIGIQTALGYLESTISNDVTFDLDWRWYDGRHSSKGDDWSGSGELNVIPISLNIIAKLEDQSFGGYISGGYTHYMNKIKSEAWMGAGTYSIGSYEEYGILTLYQLVDAVKIPVKIDQSWNAHGMNAGGGIDIKFSKNAGIGIDARYFYCPPKTLRWEWTPGTYKGHFFSDFSFSVSNEDLKYYAKKTSDFEIDLSFFQIIGGLKFYF